MITWPYSVSGQRNTTRFSMYLGSWRAWSGSLPIASRNYAPVIGEIVEGALYLDLPLID